MIKNVELDLQLFANEEEKTKMSVDEYLEAVNELKANSVSKADYEQLLEEKKKLTRQVLNSSPATDEEPVARTREELEKENRYLRNELYLTDAPELTNLEYVEKTLKLRDNILELGGEDPFLPNGDYTVTEDDRVKATRTAEGLKAMVEEAEGNPTKFRMLYEERVRDIKLPPRK